MDFLKTIFTTSKDNTSDTNNEEVQFLSINGDAGSINPLLETSPPEKPSKYDNKTVSQIKALVNILHSEGTNESNKDIFKRYMFKDCPVLFAPLGDIFDDTQLKFKSGENIKCDDDVNLIEYIILTMINGVVIH